MANEKERMRWWCCREKKKKEVKSLSGEKVDGRKKKKTLDDLKGKQTSWEEL